ncbi:leucyl/phenylalanyl-tRNA--protein transferase [Hymenobacter guriensis]|uniref:Leucyl/phenylalanyl-tRNA--protein transferase n=1 Tax=Hymenobacter guriensis TaxID=2793065 RepID=A0ABS0L0F4_9BACT|nr:leucyl/phenylalanyl-tRNA--protein transferase [Hymenobacter guriensis]MBG8553597.1 leucyl/phenylalanyl-tRNA--protein transferase [Hymenobacter guriensis]
MLLPFPDNPDKAADDSVEGLVLLGGEPTVENLTAAYSRGIFPWPVEGWPVLPWFCPPRRGILRLERLHVGRSLARALRQSPWRISFNEAFEQVMHACRQQLRPEQAGTWITPQLIRGYVALHRAGRAHSVEVWDGAELVGGLYGVAVRGVFAGESMFHTRPNASKLALLALIESLRRQGATLLDIQQLTPHLAALGAEEVSRREFLKLLKQEQAADRHLHFGPNPAPSRTP